MRRRLFASFGAAAGIFVLMCLAPLNLAGQTATPAAKTPAKAWTMPRTPDGHPDFQGNWNLATLTPLERPDAAKDLKLSEDEAAALERAEKDRVQQRAQPSRGDRPAPPVGANVGGHHNFLI